MTRSFLPALCVVAWAFSLGADAFYSKDSPVLQVTARTYDSLIARSNHTSIVEFYAPWCGHCQNLKPAYEKAAKSLSGLAKVAAIDCDDEANKPLCGQMGIQGFPTLKIVKPGAKPGRPSVEDYNGPRSAKGIVDAVKDKMPNHVTRLQGDALDAWLKDDTVPAKVIIFTDKGNTSPLVKSLAVDFLGSIAFAQVRDKASRDQFGVTALPSVQLIPNTGAPPIVYDGDIDRQSLVRFLTQIAPPNPDPAPKAPKKGKSSTKTKSAPPSPVSAAFSKASEAHKSSDFDDHLAGSGTVVPDDEFAAKSPSPDAEEEKPLVVEQAAPPLPTLSTAAEVEAACLQPKSGNCLLVLLPSMSDPDEILPESVTIALVSMAELAAKHNKRKAAMIPAYSVPDGNEAAKRIRQHLGLVADDQLEIIALNVKRGWWRRHAPGAYGASDIENFVDAIKLGEGSRLALPDDFAVSRKQESSAATEASPKATPVAHVEL